MDIRTEYIFNILESSLNGSIARQKTIAHNVSNVNTPGFQRFKVDLEEELANKQGKSQQLSLQVTREKHIGRPHRENFSIRKDLSPGLRADGNNVDLEKEMTSMVKNSIYFNAVLNQLNKKVAVLKYVISDGKR